MIKTLIRFGVIAALGTAAAVVIAGPHRAGALATQARDQLMSVIDENIDDPVALRAQLRELEAEYPQRITQVREDLSELNVQIRQIERERAIAERVVALADRDLSELEPQLAAAQAAAPGEAGVTLAAVRFGNRSYTLNQAYTRSHQIGQTRLAYAGRAADAEHDLTWLTQQADRLEELLMQLETERSEFQAQIWQLERQVDAIARNDRLIGLMEDRKQTIDECSRYEVASLDQLHARLSEVRTRQEAELEYLAGDSQRVGYEDMARMQLDAETRRAPAADAEGRSEDARFTPVPRRSEAQRQQELAAQR